MYKKEFKNLKISPESHKIIKEYCDEKGLKLNVWVERQLILKINEIKNSNNE